MTLNPNRPILDYLRVVPSATTKEIHWAMRVPNYSLRHTIGAMVELGQIRRLRRGHYAIADHLKETA